MKRLALKLLTMSLVVIGFLIPYQCLDACYGTTCRGKDPISEGCSSSAYTVYNSTYTSSGTNGTVKNELRYSTSCVSNWTKATVYSSNANSKYLYGKVWEKPNPGYYYYYWITRSPNLYTGEWCYTDMVSGTVTVVSFAGISSVSWTGPYNPTHQYEG